MATLPKSTIVVRGGKVQSVEEWVLWNGTPENTISIKRTQQGFSSGINVPGHGGSLRKGKILRKVLQGLHVNVIARYEKLFAMANPTVEEVQQDFPRHSVVIQ